MSMSTHVVGIKPPDERWQQMKAIWDACRAAGVDPPDAVDDFFEGETPDALGAVVTLEGTPAVTEWEQPVYGGASGFEVNLRALPPDVTVIRFYNAW